MKKQIILFFTCFFLLAQSLQAQNIESMVIFGDSLSDNGNVAQLLQTLRKEKKASYIEAPFRNYLKRVVNEQAHKLHLSQTVTQWGLQAITLVADKIVAPMLVEILSKVQKVPLIPMAPYWHFHFSDGKVWNEYLADIVGLDVGNKGQYENHAFGGSWAVTLSKQITFWDFVKSPESTLMMIIKGKLIPPSLGLAVESYLLELGKANPKSLYFLLAGGNDYLNIFDLKSGNDVSKVEAYAKDVVKGILHSTNKLLKAGAEQMVIFGVPDVSLTPHFNQVAQKQMLSYAAKYHNRLLKESVDALASKYPSKKIIFINMQSLMQELIDNPLKYGITDVDSACVDVPLPTLNASNRLFPANMVLQNAVSRSGQESHMCSNAEQHVFWDEVHPTTHAHRILGERVHEILQTKGYS